MCVCILDAADETGRARNEDTDDHHTMNEARLSHLPFWGPSEAVFFLIKTSFGLTRMKRSSFGLRVRVNPWVNLGERFIRVNPTDV